MSGLDLLDLTIERAAEGYRRGRFSPSEVTTAALRRIAETEPALHAYVVVAEAEATAQARRAEAELRDGVDRGPLHGVPVAVKDIVDVLGLPTRCGSASRADAAPAPADAPVVARWRAAGAVLIGKTVTQEFAAGVLSPPARNPWDPARVPGGSSGGSAVAVASGSALAAIGSDTGGSIRIPAALTGVVGFKPAFGAVPTDGVFPLAWSLDTVGPLARTVRDAELAFAAMRGDAPPRRSADAEPDRGSLAGLRIGLSSPHFSERIAPGVAAALAACAALLQELGAAVVEAEWAEAGTARAAAFIVNRAETAAVHADLARRDPARFALLNPDLQLRVRAGGRIAAGDYLLAQRARALLRDGIARHFRTHRLDALLVPSLPATAVPADDPTLRWPDGEESAGIGYTRLTMPFNATGQPVLAMPAGFDEGGLPVGVQLAGRPGDEATLFRIGRAYERAAGWVARRPRSVPRHRASGAAESGGPTVDRRS